MFSFVCACACVCVESYIMHMRFYVLFFLSHHCTSASLSGSGPRRSDETKTPAWILFFFSKLKSSHSSPAQATEGGAGEGRDLEGRDRKTENAEATFWTRRVVPRSRQAPTDQFKLTASLLLLSSSPSGRQRCHCSYPELFRGCRIQDELSVFIFLCVPFRRSSSRIACFSDPRSDFISANFSLTVSLTFPQFWIQNSLSLRLLHCFFVFFPL